MIEARRGDIVVLADRAGRYTGKPRPALVLQADLFSGTDSTVVCLIASTRRDAPMLRAPLPADERTGLQHPSWVQIEKVTAVARQQIGQRIGSADNAAMLEVARKLTVLLGIG
jgi:mRNA interferase MazF